MKKIKHMDNILSALPPMLTGEALIDALTVLPPYSPGIRKRSAAERLLALSDLYRLYIPSDMSVEIYSKLYIALVHSLQKKIGKAAIRQHSANFKTIGQAVSGQSLGGILGGADSFTIIGTSGIGKSSAINRAISLPGADEIIEIQKPYTKIIPCLVVQCPFDSSSKGLLLEILRAVDDRLDTAYYPQAVRARATIDMLIGSVSQVALHHIGLLIVDEIQNVVTGTHGISLVRMLTQLINNSGISIVMVGTPEGSPFFEQSMRLARRAVGLTYTTSPCDDFFRRFCLSLYAMPYTERKAKMQDGTVEWLYEHSGGLVSVVVSLIHDAQEIAILNGCEELSLGTLKEAYQNRMTMLHGYMPAQAERTTAHAARRRKSTPSPARSTRAATDDGIRIHDILSMAKENGRDPISLLGEYISIEEVRI